MREVLLNSYFYLNKFRLREVSHLSEVTGVLSVRAGSGAHSRAMGREIAVSTIDDVYPHNFPSTGLDKGHG